MLKTQLKPNQGIPQNLFYLQNFRVILVFQAIVRGQFIEWMMNGSKPKCKILNKIGCQGWTGQN